MINEQIIHSAPDEFIVYGNNIRGSFSPNTPGLAIAAIAQLDEGVYEDGIWIPGRRLNGDDIMIDYDLTKKAKENKTGAGLKFQGGEQKYSEGEAISLRIRKINHGGTQQHEVPIAIGSTE